MVLASQGRTRICKFSSSPHLQLQTCVFSRRPPFPKYVHVPGTPPTSTPPARSAALPGWITPQEIEESRAFWQRYYEEPLTTDDVIGLLLNVGNLFRVLSEAYDEERQK